MERSIRNGRSDRSVLMRSRRLGFSLLEMIIVLSIIAILASIAVPMYQSVILRTKEVVLKDTLYTLRSLVDAYTADKQEAPQRLEDLVEAGYLRELPEDPMTGSRETWDIEFGTVDIPGQMTTGIVDVHSRSTDISTEGTQYSEW